MMYKNHLYKQKWKKLLDIMMELKLDFLKLLEQEWYQNVISFKKSLKEIWYIY